MILLGLFTFSAIAQDQPDSNALKKNEIHINTLHTLFGFPDFTYERILNDESGLGISVAFSLGGEIDYNYLIIPYYRLYFGEKHASGFFLEANSALASTDSWDWVRDYDYEKSLYFHFGFWVACGGKFLTKSGWVGELYLGLGRYFTKNKYGDEVYPRIGITFGKRF